MPKPSKEEELIAYKLSKIQINGSMEAALNITNKCFQACITNFRVRKLDDNEQLCVYKCVDKNQLFLAALGNQFNKINEDFGDL
ncbi:hypothetical protein CYY_006206 [Polysphondylium violaceum]|uniref:Mitochondrial import inner membrane translocase subunit n=1 Tax=Polysphondylium violaceum TaxID=133409 RepID=A0A8J4PSN2_9MYCE|nr:hypothetical protein CYY_006206 [Polysphondylium violaceum]